jgi:SET domain-containing protein
MRRQNRSWKKHPLIVFKSSVIHGTGGFARRPIRRGKRIIEYVGQKLSKAEAQAELQKQNVYIFILDDTYDIDGSVEWNAARFLNHSCNPNCEVEIVRDRIWIYALRDIQAGEELTYNYSYDFEDFEHRPCHCGAYNCVGYMVAERFFATVQQCQPS